MSLIVDINPVPWKILDLVKARILKNRAKKAGRGLNWSKETLKRETSLKAGPLLRGRRQEPSFAVDEGPVYTTSSRITYEVIRAGDPNVWEVRMEVKVYIRFTPDSQRQLVGVLNTSNFVVQFLTDVYQIGTGQWVNESIELKASGFQVYAQIHDFVDPQTGNQALPLVSLTATIPAESPVLSKLAAYFFTYLPDDRWMQPGIEAGNPVLQWPTTNGITNIQATQYAIVPAGLEDSYPGIVLSRQKIGVSIVSGSFAQYDISKIAMLPGYVKTIATQVYGDNDGGPIFIGDPYTGADRN